MIALPPNLPGKIVDAGAFDFPLSQAHIDAAAKHARDHHFAGVRINCCGVHVVVLANGEYGHDVLEGCVASPVAECRPGFPHQDSVRPNQPF